MVVIQIESRANGYHMRGIDEVGVNPTARKRLRDVILSQMPDHLFTRSCDIAAPVTELRDWHFQPGAFQKLTPTWERARVIDGPPALCDGALITIEVRMGPLRLRWIAEHEVTPFGFVDRQIKGPFALWEHSHHFDRIDDARSRLTDSIRYRLPFGRLGSLFGKPFIEAKLDRLFRYRHEITARDLMQTER